MRPLLFTATAAIFLAKRGMVKLSSVSRTERFQLAFAWPMRSMSTPAPLRKCRPRPPALAKGHRRGAVEVDVALVLGRLDGGLPTDAAHGGVPVDEGHAPRRVDRRPGRRVDRRQAQRPGLLGHGGPEDHLLHLATQGV